MDIIIKKMEIEDEIMGKAYVHWKAWHEAYPGLVSQDYLDRLTLERCEEMARRWTDGILVAMLMYGKEASNRKQEIDRQHYTIPNQRPKDKHCGKI